MNDGQRIFFPDAKMCSLSLCHITEDDAEKLLNHTWWGSGIIAYPKEGGFFVFVSDEPGERERLQAEGFSEAFCDLFEEATRQGYWWILFDSDEQRLSGLRFFDW